MKALAPALVLALMPVLQGCAAASHDRMGTTAAEVRVIPFTRAEVTRTAGSDDHVLAWSAPGVQRVTVFAGASPDTIDRSRPVATGGGDARVTVTGLAPGRRWFFALVADRGAALIIADRNLRLGSVPNLRDIGGYATSDGRWVRMGMIYRSDQLDRISDADLAAMGGLGLGLVADLRTEAERRREVDRVPAGAEYLVLDVAKDSAAGLGGDMRQAMALIAGGKGAELLTEANREFVSLPSARAAYIEAAFDEVERRHGSMDAYVRDGLGIDDATIARLRARLLQGAPG